MKYKSFTFLFAFFITPKIFSLDLNVLSQDPLWLKLGHWQKKGSEYISTIDSESFFINPFGKTQPYQELLATVDFLKNDKKIFHHDRFYKTHCLFPARARFLRDSHVILKDLTPCRDFEQWKESIGARSISLIFSSSYPGNPASMLGHTFLKINYKEEHSPLLDYSISFMANVPPDVSWGYVYNGITGGYKGFFKVQPYYEHVTTYNHFENRDLWEYPLRIDQEKVSFLMDHIWELYSTAYADYFFLTDNCSALLLELLDVIYDHGVLAERRSVVAIPHDIVQIILKHIPHEAARFLPSQKKKFKQLYASLDTPESNQLNNFFLEQDVTKKAITEKDNQEKNAYVWDAIIAKINLDKSESKLSEQMKIRQLEKRALLSRSKIVHRTLRALPSFDLSNNPGRSHGSKTVAMGYQYSAEYSYQIKYKYGVHDLLDKSDGFEPWFQFNMFDFNLIGNTKNDFQLNLGIADIISLNPLTRFDRKLSWKVSGGIEQFPELMRIYLYGGGGYAINLKNTMFALMLLQKSSTTSENPQTSSLIFTEFSIYGSFADFWKYKFAYNSKFYKLRVQEKTRDILYQFNNRFHFPDHKFLDISLAKFRNENYSVEGRIGLHF